jgi:ribosome biogenesis protein BMS1
MDGHEKKVYTLMQTIQTIKKDKDFKRKLKTKERRAEYMKKREKVQLLDIEKKKERMKDVHKKAGQKRALAEAREAGGRFGSSKRSKPSASDD